MFWTGESSRQVVAHGGSQYNFCPPPPSPPPLSLFQSAILSNTIKQLLRAHYRISLLGNPANTQVQIPVFVFRAFLDSGPAGYFLRATSGIASFSFTLELYCIIPVTRITERYNYEKDESYLYLKVLAILCVDQEDSSKPYHLASFLLKHRM